MKCRHAAALTLVGWYLMIPPINNKSDEFTAITIPLNYWYNLEQYDSAEQCQARASVLQSTGAREENESDTELLKMGLFKTADAARTWAMSIHNARCFASDDPRLKGN